jgi:hypothetical protein
MPIDMYCGQAMLSFVSNPLVSLLFLRIFMSLAFCLKVYVNTVMGDADLKHFSYSDLQHPNPKSVARVSLSNDFCLSLIKSFLGRPMFSPIAGSCLLST